MIVAGSKLSTCIITKNLAAAVVKSTFEPVHEISNNAAFWHV